MKVTQIAGMFYSWFYYKKDRYRLEKLMSRGLKVGKNVYIMEDVNFDPNYPFLIEIGNNCRISKDVRILAHDATTFRILGITRIAPVTILEGSFIGERAIILPGVTIGPNAMIAAGSVVNRDIGEDKVAAGNPARPYGSYSDLIEKYRESVSPKHVIYKEDFEKGKVTQRAITDMVSKTGIAFMYGVPKEDPYYIHSDMKEIRDNAIRAFHDTMSSRKESGAS